jgi:Uma2 family endonuclease
MATSTAIPVEEYLRTTYEPDREYVDGQLVERNVGEWRHSLVQMLTGALLLSRAQGRFLVFSELRIRVSADPLRYRIPDLCVVALPYPPEPVLTRPPHLVIEITSPDDGAADVLEKVGEYLAAGVPHIWMPDPYRHTLYEADQMGIRGCSSLTAETDLVGRVDFRELFARLDETGDTKNER